MKAQPADVVIEPDVTQVDLSDFSKTKEMALEGERATLEVIPKNQVTTHSNRWKIVPWVVMCKDRPEPISPSPVGACVDREMS